MKKVCLIVLVLVVLSIFGIDCNGTVDAATLSVDAGSSVYPFNPKMLGSNIGIWEWNNYYPSAKPVLVNVIKEAGIKMLRYPAGGEAEMCYFDRSNSYPVGSPPSPYERTMRADHLDAYIALCKLTDAEPIIVVNVRIDNADMAADIVRYCNIDKKYNVKYFEIGNEPEGYSSSVGQYAEKMSRYADAMKAVDPNIIICGNAITQPINISSWLKPVMESYGSKMDAVTVHWYPLSADQKVVTHPAYPSIDHLLTWDNYDLYPTNEWHYSATIAYANRFVKTAATNLLNLRNQYSPNAEIGITELSPVTSSATGEDGAGVSDTLANALWLGDVLGRLAYNGVDFVNQFLVQGDQEYSLCSDTYTLRPAWYTYVMYNRYFGNNLVKSVSSDNQNLTVWASRKTGNSNKLYVMVINKNQTQNQNADISFTNFVPTASTALKWELNGSAVNATTCSINGIQADGNCTFASEINGQTVSNVGTTFSYTYPAHSITCFEFTGDITEEAAPIETVKTGLGTKGNSENFDELSPGSLLPQGWEGSTVNIEGSNGNNHILLSNQNGATGTFTFPAPIPLAQSRVSGEAIIEADLTTKEITGNDRKDKFFKILDSNDTEILYLSINMDGWVRFKKSDGMDSGLRDNSGVWQGVAANEVIRVKLVFNLQSRTLTLYLKRNGGEYFIPEINASGIRAENLSINSAFTNIDKVKLQFSSASSMINNMTLDNFTYPVLADIELPQWPTDTTINANTITTQGLVLDWSAATDNWGVEKYNIYQNGTLIGTTDLTAYTVTGLQQGTGYSFKVEAIDFGENPSNITPQIDFSTVHIPGYSIMEPITVKKDNSIVGQLSTGATRSTVSVKNCSSYTLPASMVVALYQGSRLINVKVMSKEIASNTTDNFCIDMDVNHVDNNTVMKVFLFDGLNGITPITAPLTLDNQPNE